MRIVIFGGSFDPPHKGHLNMAVHAARYLKPDKFLIIPDYLPPHKELSSLTPSPEDRLELCRLCFESVPGAEVSDIEIARGGKSYTSDTLRALRGQYPDADLTLLVGGDMFKTVDAWHEADYILQTAALCAFPRSKKDATALEEKARVLRRLRGAEVQIIKQRPLPASSTNLRRALRFRGGTGLLTGAVYAYIVKHRLYGVRVNFEWLRKQGYAMLKLGRIAHVRGCEEEAVRLAERYGADRDRAAEAAILHDCTKKEQLEEQLRLCEKYGIIPDDIERTNKKLLHAKTGAAVAEREFGMDEKVAEAIRWHTTGRADMTLLEKVIYMADYIEPNRDFEGVEELRKLACEDLDRAVLRGLEMSLEDVEARGEVSHPNTVAAIEFLKHGGKNAGPKRNR